ncbi:energy transducer TonB [Flavobacterium sp. NRK1]|uniref:energy transducer TonB n=1 Tax=Flavobacterium sp. NRK1 TaxID=2954929 RepID=UPI002093349E|nr:energy transducer TonB [Flavobacterium sp. NRK1]MCO6148049.1 energy transducer TonB [Flavobacterium sp. NRK1]
MMTKKTNRMQALVKQVLVLPLIAVMLIISCNNTPENIEKADNAIYNTGLEKQPEFPGGIAAFYQLVNKNFTVPEINKDLVAKIYVSFVIEKDGTMSEIKAVRDPGYGLGEEAKRVLESIDQKWSPAVKDGQPVRASYNLPITINIKS